MNKCPKPPNGRGVFSNFCHLVIGICFAPSSLTKAGGFRSCPPFLAFTGPGRSLLQRGLDQLLQLRICTVGIDGCGRELCESPHHLENHSRLLCSIEKVFLRLRNHVRYSWNSGPFGRSNKARFLCTIWVGNRSSINTSIRGDLSNETLQKYFDISIIASSHILGTFERSVEVQWRIVRTHNKSAYLCHDQSGGGRYCVGLKGSRISGDTFV